MRVSVFVTEAARQVERILIIYTKLFTHLNKMESLFSTKFDFIPLTIKSLPQISLDCLSQFKVVINACC